MRLQIFSLLFLFSTVYGKTAEVANTVPATYFVPCSEYARNCYPGIEHCLEHQDCVLKTWIILTVLLIPTLVFTIVTIICYIVLKKQKIWHICLMALFIVSLVGLLIGAIVTGIYSEDQEIPISGGEGSTEKQQTDSNANTTEPDQGSMTFHTSYIGFGKAVGYTFLCLYPLLAYLIVAGLIYHMCRLNSSKFDSNESSN